MKLLFKLCMLALSTSLAACQQTMPRQIPKSVDLLPPAVHGMGTPVAPAAAQQSSAIITLHLAQENAESALMAVDVGGTSLYALAQPVLTQADLKRVTPVIDQGQRTFILLEMNQNGIAKLRNITIQAQGHYLLLSVQGQLVSVAQIREPIADGRLLIGTQDAQHTRDIIKLMQGGQ